MGSKTIMNSKKRGKLLYKIHKGLGIELSVLNKISSEQLDYIQFHFNESTFLDACPGSGKTEVLGLKVSLYANLPTNKYKGLAAITFTQSAAKELDQRIKKYKGTNLSYPHFVGTFDSWIHNYLFQPFGHSITGYEGKSGDKSFHIVNIDSTAHFLNNYSIDLWKNNRPTSIKANQYYINFNGEIECIDEEVKSAIENKTPDEATQLKILKKKFFKAGFVTYSDVEFISYRLLLKNQILLERLAKRFPIIMVDECQDLSPTQIEILGLLKNKGVSLQFIGDLNQSIYEFRKVDPEKIREFIDNNHLIKKYLTHNFRSGQSIVNVTTSLIPSSVKIIGNEKEIGTEVCLLWEYDDTTFSQLPQKYCDFINSKGLTPSKCAIIARGTSTLKELKPQSQKVKSIMELIANALNSWYTIERQTTDMNNALYQLGKAICFLGYSGKGNSKNQFCPDEVDAILWRKLLGNILNTLNGLFPFHQNGNDLTWSRWVSNLKTELNTIWASLPNCKIEWENVKSRLRAPQGRANESVASSIFTVTQPVIIRSTTIHSVKGETVDAILLISHKNKQSKGGHFSHWLQSNTSDPEHIRFAYVACSRPKYFLIIATPKRTTNETNSLVNLGFAVHS